MTNNNSSLVPIQEVQYIENNLTEQEIAQQWVQKQWFNPQAKFDGDLVVFPAWSEEWEDLRVACMATNCGDTYVSYWKHANCSYSYPRNIEWSTHANLRCPSCGTKADISRWSFKCHGSGHSYRSTDLITLTEVVSMLLEYPTANRQFASKFLKSAKEVFNG